MPKRGRPRKNRSLYTVKKFVEYNSDTDLDEDNVLNNVPVEIPRSRDETPHLPQEGELFNQYQEVYSHDMEQQNENQLHEEQGVAQQQVEQAGEMFNQYQENQVEEEQEGAQQQVEQAGEMYNDVHEPNNPNPVFSDSDSDMEDELPDEDYTTILNKLKSEWLLTEINHSVSKTASDAFWKLGLKYFTNLSTAPGNKKTPFFKTIRRNMYKDLLPAIDLEIGYRNRSTGEITIANETYTPMKNFPAARFEKLFEIATLKVSLKILTMPD